MKRNRYVMRQSRFISQQTWFAVSAILGLSHLCFGFAANGHHIVAFVSEQELTTPTRLALRNLLPNETLVEVSTWADAERERNRATSPWHYVDYNITTGKIEAEYSQQPNILDAISSNSAALRSAQSTETRQRALKFIVHFIGDLHQPLHCADNNDSGGNKTQVLLNGEQTRLHRVWDGPVVDCMLADKYSGKSLQEVAALLHAKYLPRRDEILSGTVENWARESFEVAKNHVYRLPHPAAEGQPYPIDEDYLTKSEAIVEEQLAKAGFRLAHLLNTLLDPSYHAMVPTKDVGSPNEAGEKGSPAQATPRISRPSREERRPVAIP